MKKILIIFAHPALSKSKIHRRLTDSVNNLPGITVNNLYENYPDFYIDIIKEQQLLIEHDIIVLQHPLYWYSAPAIIKHWQDLVLERGFAYGPGGTALRGKTMLQAVSTGGPVASYRVEGAHGGPLIEYLRPFQQMARFTGMHPLPPLVIQGGLTATDAQISAHAARYRALLAGFRPPSPSSAAANPPEGT